MENVAKIWEHDPDDADDDGDDDDDLGYAVEPENWEEDALSLQPRTEQDASCPFFNLPREVVEQLRMLRVEEWLNMLLDGMNAQIRGGTYIDQPNTFRLGQEDEGFIDDPNRQQEEEQEEQEQEQEEEDKREGAEGGQEDDDQSLHSSDSDPSLHSDNSKELGIDFSKQAPP